ALAAYAAADAPWLPVEEAATVASPSSTAFATATTLSRSLYDQVGFTLSFFSQSCAQPFPGRLSTGVPPSPSVSATRWSVTGRNGGYRHTPRPARRCQSPSAPVRSYSAIKLADHSPSWQAGHPSNIRLSSYQAAHRWQRSPTKRDRVAGAFTGRAPGTPGGRSGHRAFPARSPLRSPCPAPAPRRDRRS